MYVNIGHTLVVNSQDSEINILHTQLFYTYYEKIKQTFIQTV